MIDKNLLVLVNYNWIIYRAQLFTKDYYVYQDLAHNVIELFLKDDCTFTQKTDDLNSDFQKYIHFMLKYQYVKIFERDRVKLYDLEDAYNIKEDDVIDKQELEEKIEFFVSNLKDTTRKDLVIDILSGKSEDFLIKKYDTNKAGLTQMITSVNSHVYNGSKMGRMTKNSAKRKVINIRKIPVKFRKLYKLYHIEGLLLKDCLKKSGMTMKDYKAMDMAIRRLK